jgi:hypothetical protein
VIAISPDGRFFVYQTREGLYLRSMDNLEARLIPGTSEGLASPFVSPDGQWVGYFAGTGQLKKIAVTGSTPVTLCAATAAFGASWGPDNTILFGQSTGIKRVSANGGGAELIIPTGDGEQIYGPQLLPDGRSVLFSVTRNQGPTAGTRRRSWCSQSPRVSEKSSFRAGATLATCRRAISFTRYGTAYSGLPSTPLA